ncbi:sigma-54-dependent Fis family transcriptional regulator [Wukongibacter sp. M2B1]|uniref:sigma-54-dependent Fis family transcriptional regulator n=1 Tax=Wukongibacter sp. M2B1 TaxID=3088895 RepID=UPI003D7AFD4F
MDLINISQNVQRIAKAIESVINVDVTIIDDKLNRIAATGLYVKNIGNKVSPNTAMAYTLRHGEEIIIEEPRTHKACEKCEAKDDCQEYAEVCCPIKVNGRVKGVIGLIAFDQNQKRSIVSNKENLLEFLTRMSDLIATKLIEEKKTQEINLLAKELEVLLDSIDMGVVSLDTKGNILNYNSKAINIFGIKNKGEHLSNIKELVEDFELEPIVNNKKPIRNRKFYYNVNGNNLSGIYNVNLIFVDGEVIGLVLTFSKMNEVINVVNDVIGASLEMTFDDIIGKSTTLGLVKDFAKRAAKSTSTILIQGESGTGKELFARAIHFSSDRRKYPFIPINCAAIPENLLESELFGYEEGAFTGARKGGKTGKFELANRGTIFLDEIGDMPIHLQTKLLRVLQENLIARIGCRGFIPIDVRIIAATNKKLDDMVEDGEFREDLYYRLNVIPLYIPPLRDRKEDISVLANKFVDKFNYKLDKNIFEIDQDVIEAFMDYHWPGNVRELENTIEYSVNMATESSITISDLPKRIGISKPEEVLNYSQRIIPIKDLEKREIMKAMEVFGKSKKAMDKAASALGISRATIYRKIKEYYLD